MKALERKSRGIMTESLFPQKILGQQRTKETCKKKILVVCHYSSVSKESACNAGGPALIPGLGRSPAEGIGYSLQYSWASLMAQLVKNPPAMWETWVGKIPWRREIRPTPVSWPGEFHGLYSPWGHKESDGLIDFHFHFSLSGY